PSAAAAAARPKLARVALRRGAALQRYGAVLGGRGVERLDCARLAERVLAAEQRWGGAADRGREVLQLELVGVRGRRRDRLDLLAPAKHDGGRLHVPWIGER